MTDNRSPLAKARDDWFASEEGRGCNDYSTLTGGEFLRNRIDLAFMAGVEAGMKAAVDKFNEELKRF